MAFERCVGCRWYSETMNWCYDPEKGKRAAGSFEARHVRRSALRPHGALPDQRLEPLPRQ